jgi:hypothetical protein
VGPTIDQLAVDVVPVVLVLLQDCTSVQEFPVPDDVLKLKLSLNKLLLKEGPPTSKGSPIEAEKSKLLVVVVFIECTYVLVAVLANELWTARCVPPPLSTED